MKISIWHNIMWARYKAGVFSALARQAQRQGIDVRIYQIAETEARRTVLSPVDLSLHDYPHTLVFRGSYSAVPKGRLFWTLMKLAWSDSADLIILGGYDRPEVWLQMLVLLLRGKGFALFCDSTVYDNEQRLPKEIGKRVIFGLSKGFLSYGQRAVEYLNHYGIPKERIFIRRQAAALPPGYSPEAALKRRTEIASPAGAPRYLYVGRISQEKSLDRLLRAFPHVLERHPRATLVLVGKGPLETQLKELATELGIDSRVQFVGAKSDQALFDEYLTATCLVLPSYSEPWGLVVNESLSYGCPAIVSHRCGCLPELIVEGQTGFVFDWSDPHDLAQKLIDAPEEFGEVSRIAQACLDRIASFTPELAAEGILNGALAIAGRGPTDSL